MFFAEVPKNNLGWVQEPVECMNFEHPSLHSGSGEKGVFLFENPAKILKISQNCVLKESNE